MAKFVVLGLAGFLAGCATAPQDPLVFIRTDGQEIRGNAALTQQAQVDSTICAGQTQQSAVGMPIIYTGTGLAGALEGAAVNSQRQSALGDVARGCMAQKGYIQVHESQKDEQLDELRKTASVRKKLAQ